MINTFVATAAATIAWSIIESVHRGKASMLGAASGMVAGLVAITLSCGTIGPMGSIILGAVVSLVDSVLSVVPEVVSVVVVGLVGAVAAYVATVPDVDPPVPTSVVDDTLEVGDCVVLVPSASGVVAYERSCSGRVSGRIEAIVAYPAPCPAGTYATPIVSERTTLCLVT